MSTWNILRWLQPRAAKVPYRRRPQRRPAVRLRLEQLEDRLNPSLITVTSSGDSGANTLRAALTSASSGDTIDFAAAVRTIDLTSAGLTISTNVTIQNDMGTGPVTIDGGLMFKVFTVSSGVTASLSGLTVSDGLASTSDGGAFTNHGTLTVTDCTISNNSGNGADGAGFFSDNTLTVTDCTISNNVGVGSSDGAGIKCGGTLTVSGCTFSNNSVNSGGGNPRNGVCIYILGGSTGTISDSTFSSNTGGYGGAIDDENAMLMVSGCTFSANSSFEGGGIYNSGTVTVSDSTFSTNSASQDGGSIYTSSGTVTVNDSTFSGNSASDQGGGIDNERTLVVNDCTFSANSAPDGGGIYNNDTLTVNDCTLSGNRAGVGDPGSGGGIFNDDETVTLNGTIVAGNFNGASPSTTADDIANDVTSDSMDNLIGTGGSGGLTDGTNGNQVGVSLADVGLAPLGNYGGPTQTLALLPGSFAIGKGQPAPETGTLANDQRGAPRPAAGQSDVGAFQDEGYTLTPSNTPQSANVNTAFAEPLLVTLTENFQNDPLPGATIGYVAATVGGASANLSSNTAVTSAAAATLGQASVTATANGTAGGPYNVTASDAGTVPDKATFALTNNGSLAGPTITVNPNSLNLGTTTPGTAGRTQSYTVSGSDLTDGIVITPATGVQIAVGSGAFQTTAVTLPETGGTVGNTTINVEISPNAVVGPISGSITDTSTGATEQDVSVSGTVITAGSGTTSVALDASDNLVITDIAPGGKNDNLTLQSDIVNSQFIIADPTAIFVIIGTIPGATIAADEHSVDVPFAPVTGTQIQVNTLAGNDTLTVDNSLGVFSKVIAYDGGTHEAAPTQTVSFPVGPATLSQIYAVGDTLNVNDGTDTTAGTTFITTVSVERVGGDTILVSDIQTLNLTTGTGLETMSIFGTPASQTTINAGGSLNVQVSSTADFSSLMINGSAEGSLSVGINGTGLQGLVQINGGTGTGADTFVVFGTGASAGVQLNGGAGTNVMYLLASALGSFIAANAGAGSNTFVVTGIDNTVDADLGTMVINGAEGDASELLVNDFGNTTGHTYTVESNNVTRDGMGPLSYANLTSLTMDLGQGDNTATVFSQAAGTATVLTGEGGSDNVFVVVNETPGYANLDFVGGNGSEELHILQAVLDSTYTPSTPPSGAGKKSGTVDVAPPGGSLSVIQFGAFDEIVYFV